MPAAVVAAARTYREISFSISVFNVQPDDVHRIVQLLKHALNGCHVFLIAIVPTALVITQRKQWWQLLTTGQTCVLCIHSGWGWSR